jgi:hypothetical protein
VNNWDKGNGTWYVALITDNVSGEMRDVGS